MPRFLQKTSLRVRYEVSRVALACNIPLDKIPAPNKSVEEDYDRFWSWLGKRPALNGLDLPERSSKAAWDAATGAFRNVALAGELLSVDELLTFRLKPLKIERSHRFGRRFGNDRFLAIGVPISDDASFPKHVKDNLENARRDVVNWLTDSDHQILGRTWKFFFIKDNDKIAKSGLSSTLYLFAVKGEDFRQIQPGLPRPDELCSAHSPMDIFTLLDWFIPFQQNGIMQSSTAFSRIGLGMIELISSAFELIAYRVVKDNRYRNHR